MESGTAKMHNFIGATFRAEEGMDEEQALDDLTDGWAYVTALYWAVLITTGLGVIDVLVDKEANVEVDVEVDVEAGVELQVDMDMSRCPLNYEHTPYEHLP